MVRRKIKFYHRESLPLYVKFKTGMVIKRPVRDAYLFLLVHSILLVFLLSF